MNAQKSGIIEQLQHNERDTLGLYGPIRVNRLRVPLGHRTADLTKKNAASEATDNDVNTIEKGSYLPANTTPKRGRSAMSKWGKPGHKSIAKSLGYALTVGTEAAWRGFTIILLARLTEHERAALAFATLNSLDHNNAYMTASVALFGVLDGEVLA